MTSSKAAKGRLEVVGADANNLQDVDVAFPLRKVSAVVGVSGSGKSSLLADTLAAEGSRRMRTFLGTSQQELERDDVRAFIGPMPPTILVGQRGFRPSVRTTVGTATGFLGVLRRLFLAASEPFSDKLDEPVPPPGPDPYAEWLGRHCRGRVEIWAAPVRSQKTDGLTAARRLAAAGAETIRVYSETDPPRLREKGRDVPATKFRRLNPNVAHTIEASFGSVDLGAAAAPKVLRALLTNAFGVGEGAVVVSLPHAAHPALAGPFGPRLDSGKHWVHPRTPEVFAPASTHLLSFNAPGHEDSGACPTCAGLGVSRQLRMEALVAHPERPMRAGAFALWTPKNYKYVNVQHETIEGLSGLRGFDAGMPWTKLSASARSLVLEGAGDELIFDRDASGRKLGKPRRFPGFRSIILQKAATGTRAAEPLLPFVEAGPCSECEGRRWSFQARALRVGGYSVADLLAAPFSELEALAAPGGRLARSTPADARGLVEAMRRHARSLTMVGLGYLTGDRGMLDVSDGESRRARLARVLDAGEAGLCLLLDEPGRGLHEADLVGMAEALESLRGAHTVILNEHRERLWSIADWVVEIGPAAGAAGGRVTRAGPPEKRRTARSPGALRERLAVGARQPEIKIRGASIHNIEDLDCEIPLGRLTTVCGVSGSGKSSLVRGVLVPALVGEGDGGAGEARGAGRWRSVSGAARHEVVALDQTIPPPNRRSLVATYAGVFDDIRKGFGASPEAKREGLTAADFGVNAGSGRCPKCLGLGALGEGDLETVCPACGGSRFGGDVLAVRVAGSNIDEVLRTPADALGPLAESFRLPRALFEAMSNLGIGHVALGRRVDTLSGGEIQRLRLAMRLAAASSKPLIFILDEPAIGLHPEDVRVLAKALDRVLDGGRNTVIAVEHDLQLIEASDWVLEFGPGSGPEGGRIVYAGPPDALRRRSTATGRALSGKLPSPSKAGRPKPVTAGKLPVEEQVARTKALVRTLISGDAAVESAESAEGKAEPIVLLDEQLWSGRDPWEVGGGDREVPKLLLDVQRSERARDVEGLLAAWKADPGCWLAIHPFLTDLQTWGAELPRSIILVAAQHAAKEGLRLVTTRGAPTGAATDVREVRATGDRFAPEEPTADGRRRALRDAMAVGGQYVELRDRAGRLRALSTTRLVDLQQGLVGPMDPVPTHFSRHEPLGRCLMCQGRRTVKAVAEKLVIRSEAAAPETDSLLTPQAAEILKGVRRNVLIPILRRLSDDGLWEAGRPFGRLDRAEREIMLFGLWARPGPGSFLKSPKADPAEVGSWLRWDGLHAELLDQLDRSKDSGWADRVRESVREVRCALCDGSGLQAYAAILPAGGAPFSEWVGLSPQKQLARLRAVKARTERQHRTQARLVDCLSSAARGRAPHAAALKAAATEFTTMSVAALPEDGSA